MSPPSSWSLGVSRSAKPGGERSPVVEQVERALLRQRSARRQGEAAEPREELRVGLDQIRGGRDNLMNEGQHTSDGCDGAGGSVGMSDGRLDRAYGDGRRGVAEHRFHRAHLALIVVQGAGAVRAYVADVARRGV